MLAEKLKNKNLILASASPRRQMLLRELNIGFNIRIPDVKEDFPEYLVREEIPCFLAGMKSDVFIPGLLPDEILITADTIVWIENQVLNKPENMHQAKEMLVTLSGKKHEVITAVAICSAQKKIVFHVITDVYFKNLQSDEIDYYLQNFQPLDKAGAYGIQEWIGYIGVERIDGSYFNVMGLPVKEVYEGLLYF